MASHTKLVTSITHGSQVPATRLVDHTRRITVPLFFGSVIGVVITLLFFNVTLESKAYIWPLIMVFVVAGVVVFLGWLTGRRVKFDNIPVVVRTLGTDEAPYQRMVRGGKTASGLLVPVVAVPLDDQAPFRTVIMLSDVDRHNPQDPPVGSLYALAQNERGLGELSNIAEVTQEQKDLIERLAKHPRELSNRAAPLPMRRPALDRYPWWAAVEFWAGGAIGFMIGSITVLSVAN